MSVHKFRKKKTVISIILWKLTFFHLTYLIFYKTIWKIQKLVKQTKIKLFYHLFSLLFNRENLLLYYYKKYSILGICRNLSMQKKRKLDPCLMKENSACVYKPLSEKLILQWIQRNKCCTVDSRSSAVGLSALQVICGPQGPKFKRITKTTVGVI